MTDYALVRRAVETAPMVDGVERQTARAQLRALLDERDAAQAKIARYEAMFEELQVVAALDGSGVAE